MENVATSLRITPAANAILSQLAKHTGKPKAQIVEEALRQWEDRMFWSEVNTAFSQPEAPHMRRERELWESTAGDGFTRAAKPTRRRKA